MSTKNPLSTSPIHICDSCHKVFEEEDDIFNTEEGFEFCEECWHEDQDHAQCQNCDEWIDPDNTNAFFDEIWNAWFCDVACRDSFASDMVQMIHEHYKKTFL